MPFPINAMVPETVQGFRLDNDYVVIRQNDWKSVRPEGTFQFSKTFLGKIAVLEVAGGAINCLGVFNNEALAIQALSQFLVPVSPTYSSEE